jgi:hypothetical protein
MGKWGIEVVECQYDGCNENVFENNDECILHLEFPDENDADFERIKSEKDKKVQEKIKNRNFNFEGSILYRIKLEGLKTHEINFCKAKIINNIYLEKIDVSDVLFDNATLKRFTFLKEVNIWRNLSFKDTKAYTIILKNVTINEDWECENIELEFLRFEEGGYVGGFIFFGGMKNVRSIRFKGNEDLDKKIEIVGDVFLGNELMGNLDLNFVKIDGTLHLDGLKANNVLLNKTEIKGNIWFSRSELVDINFNEVEIKGETNFHTAKIAGKLDCKKVKFENLSAAEETNRVAKNRWNVLGDREEADYYFYREMEAKRVQKKWYFRYPEVIIQYCFGYGVYPERFIITWFSIILVFTAIYSTQSGINADLGFFSYFYSSVVTAITPGFGTYRPEGIYQLFASIEAIVGTFMWAAFIATFTRKYMR